jgi:hypothetical protein
MFAKGKGIRSSLIPLAIIVGMAFAVVMGVESGEEPTVSGVADDREAILASSGEFYGWAPGFAVADQAEEEQNRREAALERAAEFNGWSSAVFEASTSSDALYKQMLKWKALEEHYLFGGMYVGTLPDGTLILAK